VGAVLLSIALGDSSPVAQAFAMTAYGVGSAVFGTLPFSRKHEYQADEYGLKLMAIAGYDPEEAVVFWQRMASLSGGGSTPQFLSTHPSDASRVSNLRKQVPEAKTKAREFGVSF
jgi:predicted Zn-dependent protease